MTARIFLAVSATAAIASATPVKNGNASAEWITGATAIEPGKPIQTGIRMKIDDGWHSYWVNPGDSGMKLKAVWKLPEGWTATEPAHPYPKKFVTGELPGYGYEGEVVFPVTLTPPATVSGTPELSVTLSWLTCNDTSCVGGKAETTLELGVSGAEQVISKAAAKVPVAKEGAKLMVREEQKGVLDLTLSLPAGAKVDPASSEIFPATESAVDHSKLIRFEKSGPTWSAKVPKNEFADDVLTELKLVIVDEGVAPIEVTWTAGK